MGRGICDGCGQSKLLRDGLCVECEEYIDVHEGNLTDGDEQSSIESAEVIDEDTKDAEGA